MTLSYDLSGSVPVQIKQVIGLASRISGVRFTLGAKDFSRAVFGFGYVFIVARATSSFVALAFGRRCVGPRSNSPQARNNLWYPG